MRKFRTIIMLTCFSVFVMYLMFGVRVVFLYGETSYQCLKCYTGPPSTEQEARNCCSGSPLHTPPPGRYKEPKSRSKKNQAIDACNRGSKLYRNGDFREAEAEYRRALRLNPNDFCTTENLLGVLRRVGRLRGIEGKYDDTKHYYSEAFKLVRNNAELRNKFKILLIEDYKDAAAWRGNTIRLREIIAHVLLKFDSKDTESHRRLGRALYEKGDLRGCKKAFRKASRITPKDYMVHTEIANLLSEAGDYKGAIKAYRQALSLTPSTDIREISTAHALIGFTLEKQGDQESALREYREAVRIAPNLALTHSFLGKLLLKRGEFKDAEDELKRALVLDSEDEDDRQSKLNLYGKQVPMLVDEDCMEETCEQLSNVIAFNPNEDIVAGLAAGRNGEYDEAIRLFSLAIDCRDLDRESIVSAFNNRGVAYRRKGIYNCAIADYTKAISLNKNFVTAYTNRGLAYAKGCLFDMAITDFTKAIKLEPCNSVIYLKRGNAYYDKRIYDRAIADYSKAIELKPDFVDAYNNRCDAYERKGLYDKMIKDCLKILEFDPNFGPAKSMLQRLDSYVAPMGSTY